VNPHLKAVPDGEVPADGPQTMAEALHHIRLLEGENEELRDQLEGVTRSWQSAKGDIRKLHRLLEEKRKVEDRRDMVFRILENWLELCVPPKGQSLVKLVEGSPRWERIIARHNEGWTEADLLLVPLGSLNYEWHNGSHPKTKGKKYHEVDTIYRDSDQVEKLVRIAKVVQERERDARVTALLAEHVPLMAEALEYEREQERLAAKFVETIGPIHPRPSELREGGRGA
jgi:hypothetical protein